VGWPGVRGERAVVMVRHNGGGDDYFRRGSTGVVVGSDEGGGGAPAVTGAEGASGGDGGGCDRGAGRKTTRWGPHVIERGWLTSWTDLAESWNRANSRRKKSFSNFF
jgi:hypothetical protein